MTDERQNRPILSDDKKSADFCMPHDRFYRPILSAINLAVELGSNFAEKIGRFYLRLSSALGVECLFHTADTDKTRQDCLVLSLSAMWTELETNVISKLNIFLQFCSVSKCGTRQNCSKHIEDYWKLSWLVANSVYTILPTQKKQDCLVLSFFVGGVNWIGDKSRLSETENFETEHV